MSTQVKLPFITLLLLISFASVNAVLFTPALPQITQYFAISNNAAQQTIVWFLIAYAFGQLIYGPISNRWGRKPALYIGIVMQIISSLVCVFAGFIHNFPLLVIGRFFLALGSGVGLKMTFTLVNECYDGKEASQKISYLLLAFAITPALSVALGGILTEHLGWMSCFYAGALYGVVLLLLVTKLPETMKVLDVKAFEIKHLIEGYATQFKNHQLVAGGLLMGSSTTFVYVFAALAPFIVMNIFGLSSSEYGFGNLLPPIGMLIGSLLVAQLVKIFPLEKLTLWGILVATLGSLLMLIAILFKLPVLIAIFLPVIIVYMGNCFIIANASTFAMQNVTDKAHGSAVMSFLNMGFATLGIMLVGIFPIKELLLPLVYLVIALFMLGFYFWLMSSHNKT